MKTLLEITLMIFALYVLYSLYTGASVVVSTGTIILILVVIIIKWWLSKPPFKSFWQ